MLFAICRSSKEECEIFISIALKWLHLLSEILSNFIYRNVQIRYIHICVVQGNSNKLFMLLFQGRTLLCVFFEEHTAHTILLFSFHNRNFSC